MKKERIIWIDQLRSIAFLFVIVGHVALPKEWQSLIYSFHMPLFFLISGLTINEEKICAIPIKEYIKGHAQRLLIPYFWMNFLMFPLWYFAFHYITQSTKLTIVEAFWGIFIGNNEIQGAPSNALWFVLVLFLANILYCVLLKLANGQENILFIMIILCGLIGYSERAIPQIWHFNVTFTAVVFMYIGNRFMKWYKSVGKKYISNVGLWEKILFIGVVIIVGLVSHEMNGRISMTANKFGDSLLLFYLTALAFSIVIILVVMYIPKIKCVTYIGQNTLLYVGIHLPILRIFEKLFPEILSNYKYSIPFAFVLYLGLIPVCMLCNKYAPYVCGKPLKQNTIPVKIFKIVLIVFGASVPYARVLKEVGLWRNAFVMLGILIILSIIFVHLCEKKFAFVFYAKNN